DCLECSVSSRDQAERVAQLGAEAVQLDVPMRIDLKFGPSWGDACHSWAELHHTAEQTNGRHTDGRRPDTARGGELNRNGHHVEAAPVSDAPIAVAEQTLTEPESETLDERLRKIPLADLIGEAPVYGEIRCPFHDDDTPSLHVYDDHYYCFGCHKHGGHLD